MSEQSKTILKSYFEAGDAPTESQFGDLIDTLFTESSALIIDASIASIESDVSTLQNIDVTLDASIQRIDGYLTGAYTGSFLIADGSTVTVENGLITNVG